MKAIWTKYLGPTNFRGSRVKASAEGVSVTVEYDNALNSEDAHAVAALALCRKAGWPENLYRGGRPDGKGFVFVFAFPGALVVNPVPSYKAQAEARKALAGSK